MASDYTPPPGFDKFCKLWREKFALAKESRKEFDKDAAVARKFYRETHDFVFEKNGGFIYEGADGDTLPIPSHRVTCNKVAEFIQLYGPILYHRNPIRRVEAKLIWKPPPESLFSQMPTLGQNPSMLAQQMAAMSLPPAFPGQMEAQDTLRRAKAELLEAYLNYTPNELNLKGEMQLCVDEALETGRGCMFTELYWMPASGQTFVGSFFTQNKDVLIDPDMPRMDDAKWISRKSIRPVWELERKYGLQPGSLKANMESTDVKAAISTNGQMSDEKKKGGTADLICYYEIWSKMGMGARLRTREQLGATVSEEIAPIMEIFGDYVYLVIAEKCNYPLNLPPQLIEQLAKISPEVLQMFVNLQQAPPIPMPPEIQAQLQVLEQAKKALAWPIPFWADEEWPVTCIDLHPLPDTPWPLNHLKPAFGEQAFLDWAYSSLAGKIQTYGRTFIAMLKQGDEKLKNTILNGRDLSLLELEAGNRPITDQVQFLTHPSFHSDFYPTIQAMERNVDKRLGTTEMIYGQTATQSRSAQDAATKGQMLQIRPDDMANKVEEAVTIMARKEAIAARLKIRGKDVEPIFGPYAATFWDSQVITDDIQLACREFDYRIEASSARKPNYQLMIENTQEGMQFILPVLQMLSQQYNQWGPLLAYIKDWAKARQFDVDKYLLSEEQMQQLQSQLMAQQQSLTQPAQQEGQPPEGGTSQERQPGQTQQMVVQGMPTDQLMALLHAILQIVVKMQVQPPVQVPVPSMEGSQYIKRQQVSRTPDGMIDFVDTYFTPVNGQDQSGPAGY